MSKKIYGNRLFVQGDVYLIETDIPKDAKEVRASKLGYVLAEGEATGHHHLIPPKFATITKLYEHDKLTIRNGMLASGIKIRDEI